MKEKDKKALKRLSYIGGAIILGSVMYNRFNEMVLTKKDFEKAEWIKYNNYDGSLWKDYKNERAGQYMGSGNWQRYQYFVNQKNNGKIQGYIWLPDLDGNGKVGGK